MWLVSVSTFAGSLGVVVPGGRYPGCLGFAVGFGGLPSKSLGIYGWLGGGGNGRQNRRRERKRGGNDEKMQPTKNRRNCLQQR